MTISVECSACKKKLKAKDELAGKRAICPSCGQTIVVRGDMCASPPTSSTPFCASEKGREPRAAPAGASRRVRWPWYVGGVAATLCLAAVAILIVSLSGNERKPANTSIAARSTATGDNSNPESKPSDKLQQSKGGHELQVTENFQAQYFIPNENGGNALEFFEFGGSTSPMLKLKSGHKYCLSIVPSTHLMNLMQRVAKAQGRSVGIGDTLVLMDALGKTLLKPEQLSFTGDEGISGSFSSPEVSDSAKSTMLSRFLLNLEVDENCKAGNHRIIVLIPVNGNLEIHSFGVDIPVSVN